MVKDIGLYVHFPFCRRKCSYCSFVSYEGCDSNIPDYVRALKREVTLRAAGKNISTIYFGGGTPSLLSPEQLGDIMSAIGSVSNIDNMSEVSIEVNPGTTSEQFFRNIRKIGVNRLSIGVQSFNDSELNILGRIHSSAEAREAVQCARKAGFSNISIDLIYGIPGQTFSDWRFSLDQAVNLDAEHISLYALSLEGSEPMSEAIERGELPALHPDLCADQFEMGEDLLSRRGYCHYEISNWAKTGFECKHNLIYWQNEPYIGIGAAAHSYMDGHRLANTCDIKAYLDAYLNDVQPVLNVDEEIGPDLNLAESIILGLRLSRGIDLVEVGKRFGINVLSHYSKQVNYLAEVGLLEIEGNDMKLTRRGRLLGNEVFWRFLPA